ncbi:hypothetical protein Tco_1331927, partial [Tanacetum coccineum]
SAVSVHVMGPSEAQKKLVYPTQRSRVDSKRVHDMLRIPVGGTILLSMEETEGDLDWLAQFGDLDPKKICATHIAEEIVKATNIDFMFKMNFLVLVTNTLASVVNIGLGGQYITDILLIGGQPIRFFTYR